MKFTVNDLNTIVLEVYLIDAILLLSFDIGLCFVGI